MGFLKGLFGKKDQEDPSVADATEHQGESEERTFKQKQYMENYSEEDSPGWMAIDEALKRVYPDTKERHYATMVKSMFGGNDPLDGFSIYDNDTQLAHRHVVSYGMSELYYNPESADSDFSKWGCEFTMRILPCELDHDTEDSNGQPVKNEPIWVTNLMQNLARYVFETGKWFEAYHFIPTNSPIRMDTDTKLVGIAFVPDPQLDSIDTPHGKVEFLQMVGLTQKELDWLWEKPKTGRVKELVDKMREENPLLITDLKRQKDYI